MVMNNPRLDQILEISVRKKRGTKPSLLLAKKDKGKSPQELQKVDKITKGCMRKSDPITLFK